MTDADRTGSPPGWPFDPDPDAPLARFIDEQAAERVAREVEALDARLRSAAAALRETTFAAASADGRLSLNMTGDGLCTGVSIEPALVAAGGEALGHAVMEAVNDAALALQDATARHMAPLADRVGVRAPDGWRAAGWER